MRYTTMLLRLLMVVPAVAFAGRSLVMTPGNQGGFVNDPNLAQNQSWRVEFQMHDWTPPPPGNFTSKIFELDGVGAVVWLFPDGGLAIGDFRDTVTPAQPCFLPTTGHSNVVVRIQRDVSQLRFSCEVWNFDGTGYASNAVAIVNTNPYTPSGGFVAGGATTSLAYLRVFTSVVPLGSRPPTTADGGNWTELKFENNLNDSSGRGHNTSVPGATYVNTPNQIAIALPKTFATPAWNNWTSLRAGYPAKLDGSASFSLADTSSTVSYFWQQVSGPSSVRWSDRTSATPTINGLVFGTYTFALRVTDAAGSTATVPLVTGAVATDNNGVVIPSDPNVEKVYGPMIAFGQNPWGYADERSLAALTLQIANNPYPAQAAQWSVPASGTISYPFAGKGPAPGPACTTLSGAISASATSIPVTNASCLSLSSLPTWILVGNAIGLQEMVRVVATTATSGPATLTVAYDGRGIAGAIYTNAQPVVPAQAWPAGTIVGEMRIQGTGTSFITDTARPMCPAGAPGPPGAVTYSTGTVSGVGGSTTLTGNGTAWTQNTGANNTNVVFLTDFSNNAITQQYIRVTGTHGGGTPFVFWAFVTKVAPGNGSLTISRPLPADFDAGNFNYKITAASYWSLEFVIAGNAYRAIQQAAGCESETAAFAIAAHDIGVVDTTTQSGVKISYKTTLGAQSPFGPNFYGTGFAERAFYYRSGYLPALTAANSIDDYWVRDPEICAGYCGGLPLLQGGGVIGAIVNRALNSSTLLNWLDVTGFASSGVVDGTRNCNYDDPRDQGYQQAWLALVALFDPDSTRNTAWINGLTRWVTRDQTCRRNASDGYGLNGAKPEQVNSWAGSSVFANVGPALTLTTGSTAVTGSGFSASMCAGQDDGTGTIHVTRGSTSATVVSGSLAPGIRIAITDPSSPIYVGTSQYSVSGANVTLALTWPGNTGTFHFMSDGPGLTGFMTSIGSSNADWPDVSVAEGFANNQQLQKFWTCKYNNPGSLTLNRPWDGTTGNSYHMYSYVVTGFEVQPFMDGVKANAMNWASKSSNPAVASAYTTMRSQLGTWMATYGVDTNPVGTLGTYYNRVSGDCEPAGVPNSTTPFDTIHAFAASPGCGFMGLTGTLGGGTGEFTARVNTAEAGSALTAYFTAQCLIGTSQCNAARAFVDKYYGAIYGNCVLTSGGGATFYCDNHYVDTAGELSNASIGAYKWAGFFFGMGMAHQWPAARFGGRQPTRNRTVSIAFTLGAAANARILVTAPSGATATFSCGTVSPCPITVDDLQGTHWYTIQYLSGGGQILSQTDPDLITAVP